MKKRKWPQEQVAVEQRTAIAVASVLVRKNQGIKVAFPDAFTHTLNPGKMKEGVHLDAHSIFGKIGHRKDDRCNQGSDDQKTLFMPHPKYQEGSHSRNFI